MRSVVPRARAARARLPCDVLSASSIIRRSSVATASTRDGLRLAAGAAELVAGREKFVPPRPSSSIKVSWAGAFFTGERSLHWPAMEDPMIRARLRSSLLLLASLPLAACYVTATPTSPPPPPPPAPQAEVVVAAPPPPPAPPPPQPAPPPPQAEVVVESAPPPPAPPPQPPPPPPPSPEHYWVAGYYGWEGREYRWHPGHYERRPHARAHWVGAHWEVRPRGRVWIEGHWD
jgi:hypothetical protein